MTDVVLYICGPYDLNEEVPAKPLNGSIVHHPEVSFAQLTLDEQYVVLVPDCTFLQDFSKEFDFAFRTIDIVDMLVASDHSFRDGQPISRYIRDHVISNEESETARLTLLPHTTYTSPTTYRSVDDEALHKKKDDVGETIAPLSYSYSELEIPPLTGVFSKDTGILYELAKYSRTELLKLNNRCVYDVPPVFAKIFCKLAQPSLSFERTMDHNLIARLEVCKDQTQEVYHNIEVLTQTLRLIKRAPTV